MKLTFACSLPATAVTPVGADGGSFDYIDKNGIVTNRTVEPYVLHFSETS
ncbi:hypothetical protein [Paenibacillus anaericanus]|nr:hypothetical protein [Paenibacillus anaericanus]